MVLISLNSFTFARTVSKSPLTRNLEYKSLSEEIRNAQAVVLAVKLELINEELDDSNKKYNEAKKNHQDTINSLSRINTEEIQLVDKLAPLKEESASDAAKFQRFIIEMEGLDNELMRQEKRIIELDDFILSIKI